MTVGNVLLYIGGPAASHTIAAAIAAVLSGMRPVTERTITRNTEDGAQKMSMKSSHTAAWGMALGAVMWRLGDRQFV